MIDSEKKDEEWIELSDRKNPSSENAPKAAGLSASLDGLSNTADKKKRNGKDTSGLVARVKEVGALVPDSLSTETSLANQRGEGSNSKSWSRMHKQLSDKAVGREESLGVVELLGALKSDIDGLRKENEAFKAQLMRSPLANHNAQDKRADDSTELRSLLEALQADIGNLREENSQLRSQASMSGEDAKDDEVLNEQEVELYEMLGELKDGLDGLRSANDVLRENNQNVVLNRAPGSDGQVASILDGLKDDISELKHKNESLHLENLTARDGARFKNLGGQEMAYRNEDRNVGTGFLKGLGVVVLAAGAAGGGYYFAKSQTGTVVQDAKRMAQVSNEPVSRSVLLEKVMKTSPPVRKTQSPAKLKVTKPVLKKQIKQPMARPQPALHKNRINEEMERAMLVRAESLLEGRDLGAARMVFVYLARHGSAGAMTRLAQTYDPQYLNDKQFDLITFADVARAKRLYGTAMGLGDKAAGQRLKELQ